MNSPTKTDAQVQRDAWGCRNSGVPLGGIGAGSFEIRPDGHFYGWTIMNNKPWGMAPETSAMEAYGLRFMLSVKDARGETRLMALEKHLGLDPKLDGWFWLSDPYHVPWVEHARNIRYQANLPFAELAYEFDGETKVEASLTAFSPLVPYSASDSNTPAAVLRFRIRNVSAEALDIGLMGLIKNVVGYDRPELPSQVAFEKGSVTGLLLSRHAIPQDHVTAGTMGLWVLPQADARESYAIHPGSGRDLCDTLREQGELANTNYALEDLGPVGEIGAERESLGPKGHPRAALAQHVRLAPGEERSISFVLTWHFPNFHDADTRNRKGERIGVQYAKRFGNARDVATFVAGQLPRLESASRQFQVAMASAALPSWMTQGVMASLAVLYRSGWWDERGRFGIWEGLGCCGLQTIDVGHYGSWPVLLMFPELDRAQMGLSADNQEKSGKVPHNMPGNFSCNNSAEGKRGRIDVCAQFVLAIWRHGLWTGDMGVVEHHWKTCKANLDLLRSFDSDGDGIPNNMGTDQTYDRFPMHGTSSFVGFTFLAALRAAADMAQWMGKAEEEAKLVQEADACKVTLEKQLWNGRYYNLSYEAAKQLANTGSLADQVNGDAFYRLSAGKALLPTERVKSALGEVMRHNHRTAGAAGWLANCVWPAGGGIRITRKGSDQANCPWSGVEYAVAAHMIAVGLRSEGRRVMHDVVGRYEAAGMRHNHIECGEFYHRCMSIWAAYLAEFGIHYDARAKHLSLRFIDEGVASQCVVFTPGGYARATWNPSERSLSLTGLAGVIAVEKVTCGSAVATPRETAIKTGNTLVLKFPRGG